MAQGVSLSVHLAKAICRKGIYVMATSVQITALICLTLIIISYIGGNKNE